MSDSNIVDMIKKIIDLPKDRLSELDNFLNTDKKSVDENKPNESIVDEPKVENTIDKTTEKYKMFLKFVNAILININKDTIDDLIQFKNINKNDINKKENIELLDDMIEELNKEYNMAKCGYIRKTDNIVTNVLRGLCKDIGLQLVSKCKTKTKNSISSYMSFYSIKL